RPAEVPPPPSSPTGAGAAVPAEAGPPDGRRVLVTGAGMLGVTAVAMAVEAGAEVVASDPDPKRRAQALRFGAHETAATAADVDVALELSGHPDAVRTCLGSLAVGGTAVLAGSVFPGPAVPLDPERLVRGVHKVTGVHNYRPADLQRAVDFLAAHHAAYPFAELVHGDYDLGTLDAAFAGAHGAGAPRQAGRPHRAAAPGS
ncbi:zinc-binding dehydrogenase, partial [Streptomyces sp. N35]|uniref:zinc-binding dehydrogenase n=1 Tax=Streptomyces sp. N35 TaxID=2795730 RepID=UPI0018F3926C